MYITQSIQNDVNSLHETNIKLSKSLKINSKKKYKMKSYKKYKAYNIINNFKNR